MLRQIAAAIAKAQKKNRGRATRLDHLLDFEIEQLRQSPPPPTPKATAGASSGPAPPAPAQEQQAQLERFQRAKQLLAQVVSDLDQSLPPLDAMVAAPQPAAKQDGQAERARLRQIARPRPIPLPAHKSPRLMRRRARRSQARRPLSRPPKLRRAIRGGPRQRPPWIMP